MDAAEHSTTAPSFGLLMLFATGAGMAVATLYYNQPMLAVIGQSLQASPSALGWIPTLTQIGYAAGMLLLAPLGDRHDRRTVILIKAAWLIAALAGAAMAPSLPALYAASLLIGLSATLAQDIVPAAAHMAPDAERGRIVGTVMSGLLLGIVLSRTLSGLVAAAWGWREMFVIAAAGTSVLWLALWRGLPALAPTARLSYGALLASLWHLWRRFAALRRAAIAQGLLSLAFGGFWSTLALLLYQPPYHQNSAVAGAYGLAGAAGALAAPVAGRLADRGGPQRVTVAGALLVSLAFALLLLQPLLPVPGYLGLLALSAVGFDLGIQSSLIAHQTIIYALDPTSRSRLTAILLVAMFSGMATGSAVSGFLLEHFGWLSVVGFCVAAGLAALGVRWRAGGV